MEAASVLAQLGGTARTAELRKVLSRETVRRAVASGDVQRVGRGRYVLPGLAQARSAAVGLSATASHTSAALHWGWGVKTEPAAPHVTLPRGRKRRGRGADLSLHWRDLDPDDVVDGWVTSPARTVIDSCLDLPFDEALAVADSSWRTGLNPLEALPAVKALPTRSRRRVISVLKHVDRGAANPFESVLRAHCITAGATVVTQHVIADRTFFARVDVAVEELGIAIEAESFEHHGDRPALKRDCRRYTGLAARGLVLLRFTWDEVMFEPYYVIEAVRATMAERRGTTTRPAAQR